MKIQGQFEVKLQALDVSALVAETGIGRMSLDKQFLGELAGTSQGEMLAYRTSTTGSAGYVAMEKVSAILQGKRGSFVLQHSSTMNKGEPHQTIQVVPDSGTDELQGLAGQMTIQIKDGQHFYELEYTLP